MIIALAFLMDTETTTLSADNALITVSYLLVIALMFLVLDREWFMYYLCGPVLFVAGCMLTNGLIDNTIMAAVLGISLGCITFLCSKPHAFYFGIGRVITNEGKFMEMSPKEAREFMRKMAEEHKEKLKAAKKKSAGEK